METEKLRLPYVLWGDDARSPSGVPAAAVVFMKNIKAYARRPQGDRTVTVRRPYGDRAVYGMATASQISTANVEMKKAITPRYNSTATPAACKT